MPYLRDLNPEDYDNGKTYEAIKNNFEWNFSDNEKMRKKVNWTVPAPNASQSDYVWLPIIFEDKIPHIYWKDRWSIQEFD